MPSSRRPPLSPAAVLRLHTKPGPETPPGTTCTAAPDAVVVTPSVGDGVVVISGRFSAGRRPIELRVDRTLFTDDELAALIAWTRRQVEKRDPARQGRLRAV